MVMLTQGRSKARIAKWVQYSLLLAYSIITLYPIYWILMTSFRTNNEIFTNPFGLPKSWLFENYISTWKTAKLGIPFINSILISSSTVLIVVTISAMCAYILARIPFRGSAILFTIAISGIFIPQQAVLLPVFLLLKQLSLLNHSWTLIIVYVAYNISLSVFIMTSFLKLLPHDLEEAAIIDGAGLNQTFFRIIVPIAKPPLATVATLAFLNVWNEFMFATLYTSSPKFHTMTVAISSFQSDYGIEYPYIACGVIISLVPVLLIYILLQKHVMMGMTSGALKG